MKADQLEELGHDIEPDGKQPYYISAADGDVLSFAGLWDRWKNPETGRPHDVVHGATVRIGTS